MFHCCCIQMDCSQCLEAYNVETRLPKLLPCGHTFCQPCLQRDARCYIENKVFPQTSDGLPDDLHLLRLLEKGMHDKERGKLRLWCDGCKTEAVERCLDNGHKLSSMKKHWHRQALERLQEMKALLEGLVGRQSGAVPAKEAQLCRSGVDVVLDDGADSWTARVQLGGSGEETTLESSALRLLIGEMCAQQRIQEISDTQALQFSTPKPVPFDAVLSADVPRQVGLKSYWFGLFDGSEDDNLSDEEECVIGLIGPETPNVKKADEVDEECLLAGLAVLEMDDEEETSNENTHVPQVRKMTEVSCQANPARTLQALADAAPHLEELQLLNADSAHVLAAHRMPALRRLEACGWFEPFLLPPLEHDGGLEHVKLQLHPITARSLIFAHQQTLRVVRILPFNSRWRELHNIYFEDLDYRGRGRVGDGDSVREGVRRCPYFPHRPPGTFPLLERIEFANFKNPNGPPYNPRWEWIEKLFPGVVLESVFEEKPMYSNKKKFRK